MNSIINGVKTKVGVLKDNLKDMRDCYFSNGQKGLSCWGRYETFTAEKVNLENLVVGVGRKLFAAELVIIFATWV